MNGANGTDGANGASSGGSDDVLVRPLRESDRERWLELWAIYLRFYEQDLDPEVTDITWDRLLAREHGMGALVATDGDGHVTGLAHHVVHASTWSRQPVCYLEDLVVDPVSRGRGFGRALIEALCLRAAELGCKNVYWHTEQDNATARHLYDRVATLSNDVRYEMELEGQR